MKDNALSIANYFIELSDCDGRTIKPLRLMKLVYLAHGYILSMLGRSCLNPRFDRVEAWKYGPVIPSVYDSFKSYGNRPINEPTVVFAGVKGDEVITEVPQLCDEDAKSVCVAVWNAYHKFSDSQLVDILHADGSPWRKHYKEGQNVLIPDEDTKSYCDKMTREMFAVPAQTDAFSEKDYSDYLHHGARVLPCNAKWLEA